MKRQARGLSYALKEKGIKNVEQPFRLWSELQARRLYHFPNSIFFGPEMQQLYCILGFAKSAKAAALRKGIATNIDCETIYIGVENESN